MRNFSVQNAILCCRFMDHCQLYMLVAYADRTIIASLSFLFRCFYKLLFVCNNPAYSSIAIKSVILFGVYEAFYPAEITFLCCFLSHLISQNLPCRSWQKFLKTSELLSNDSQGSIYFGICPAKINKEKVTENISPPLPLRRGCQSIMCGGHVFNLKKNQ